MLNVSQATYSRYESGDIEVPVSALIRLAKYYDTSIDYLVGISETTYNNYLVSKMV